jgi:abscisic acid receptor (PYR/PYL family)
VLPLLQNYSSIITVHPESIDGRPGTLVIESFVVDVPDGNTKDETCYFVEAVIKCNLTSLAEVSERLAVQSPTSPLDH